MKEQLPFDDFVKKQFNDYSPDVPPHIWENIVAAKRSSKPKGFWINNLGGKLLLLTIILLIGGGAWYFLSPGGNDTINDAVNKTGEVKTVSAGEKEYGISENKKDQNTPQSQNDLTAENEKNIDEVADQSHSPANNSTNSAKNNFNKPSAIKETGQVTELTISKVNQEEITNTTGNTELSNTILFSPFPFSKARQLSINKIPAPLNVKLPECPAIEKNAAGNKQYWEVYAGPDRAFESYKSYGDTASTNYLEKRKSSTKFASAYSAGVRYTKVFNNGTSVRTGVNYTQINEKFIYFNPNEIKFVTVITTRVVIRAPGDTIYINDTLQYQQTGSRTKTTYNRYRNIDIPLVIGYELGNGKIHANINAGVIINVYSWYKGDVLDSLYQPVSITTGKGNSVYQFKNNIGVGFLGSISLYYKMTDDLHLLLEPYFRYNLSPMSKQNLNLQQKYNIAGVRAGIRFDLK